METKSLMIFFLIGLVIVLIAGFILTEQYVENKMGSSADLGPIKNNSNTETLKASGLEDCQILKENGPGKINVVFFANKELVEAYVNFFLDTSPFDKNKEAFNFYYITNYKPECELYKGIAILCHSKELIKKAASCPNDQIIVLEERDNTIRSSAYQNVMSINQNHPKSVLTHEFGHSFANLAEEYTPAKVPKGSENCVSECSEFQGETDGCFEGCSKTNYFRSINSGVMRTLSSNSYGIFNEQIVLERITENTQSTITGSAIETGIDCLNQEHYLIEANYSQGEITLIEKTLEPGCVGNNGAGGFNYQIIKEDNTTILEGEFNPELIFTTSPGEIAGEVFEQEGTFLLRIPVIKNSKTLQILEADNLLTNISLQDIGVRPCKK